MEMLLQVTPGTEAAGPAVAVSLEACAGAERGHGGTGGVEGEGEVALILLTVWLPGFCSLWAE